MTAQSQRAHALDCLRQTHMLLWLARDLLTESGDHGEAGEITAMLRILEDVQAMTEARERDTKKAHQT